MNETVSIETITPAWAEAELQKQEKLIADGEYRQRPLSKLAVRKYANDMRRGHWRANGQGIEFDEKGFLRNGRTRLWAVVKAQVPVRMLVYRGPGVVQSNGTEVNLVDTIDCGRSRSVGQQLTLDGIPNANIYAAALRAIAIISIRSRHTRLGIMPAKEIWSIYGSQLQKSYAALHTNARYSRGFIIGPLAMYRSFNAGKADQFADDYIRLEKLAYNHPAMALRRTVENNHDYSSDGIVRCIYATCLALQHFNENSLVNGLRYSTIGVDWIHSEQAKNVKKVRQIIGDDMAEDQPT